MSEAFETWAIVEIMGHRRYAGWLTEQTIAGAGFLRIDAPTPKGTVSKLFSPSSVYCITPTTEEIVQAMAARNMVAPVSRYELQLPAPAADVEDDDDGDLELDIDDGIPGIPY